MLQTLSNNLLREKRAKRTPGPAEEGGQQDAATDGAALVLEGGEGEQQPRHRVTQRVGEARQQRRGVILASGRTATPTVSSTAFSSAFIAS